jgi:putative ABC transport system permease protein
MVVDGPRHQPAGARRPAERTGQDRQPGPRLCWWTARRSAERRRTLQESVNGIDPNASVYVERGFQDNSMTVALLLLGAVGGVLVLGARSPHPSWRQSDARPDFATLSAVGAAPGCVVSWRPRTPE